VLLTARDAETGAGMTAESIRNQILIFFIAGALPQRERERERERGGLM
jgi:hypothetical protein